MTAAPPPNNPRQISLFRNRYQISAYFVLSLLAAIALLAFDDYYLLQLTLVCIYAIAGTGMVLLVGYTGQVSLGHAAFFAVGAYTVAILQGLGISFLFSFPAAGLLAGVVGVGVGLLISRLSGPYLAMATMAFAFIVEETISRWESVTNGNLGLHLDHINILSFRIDAEWKYYCLALGALVLVMLATINILRSRTGRAMIAVRDSEVAAQCTGIDIVRYKTLAFALSAGFTGLSGALYAHKLLFISPEAFTFLLSLELLILAVVGGLRSLHGAVFGAIFIIMVPQVLLLGRDFLPYYPVDEAALQGVIYGAALFLVIFCEPSGLFGIWARFKRFVSRTAFGGKAAA